MDFQHRPRLKLSAKRVDCRYSCLLNPILRRANALRVRSAAVNRDRGNADADRQIGIGAGKTEIVFDVHKFIGGRGEFYQRQFLRLISRRSVADQFDVERDFPTSFQRLFSSVNACSAACLSFASNFANSCGSTERISISNEASAAIELTLVPPRIIPTLKVVFGSVGV